MTFLGDLRRRTISIKEFTTTDVITKLKDIIQRSNDDDVKKEATEIFRSIKQEFDVQTEQLRQNTTQAIVDQLQFSQYLASSAEECFYAFGFRGLTEFAENSDTYMEDCISFLRTVEPDAASIESADKFIRRAVLKLRTKKRVRQDGTEVAKGKEPDEKEVAKGEDGKVDVAMPSVDKDAAMPSVNKEESREPCGFRATTSPGSRRRGNGVVGKANDKDPIWPDKPSPSSFSRSPGLKRRTMDDSEPIANNSSEPISAQPVIVTEAPGTPVFVTPEQEAPSSATPNISSSRPSLDSNSSGRSSCATSETSETSEVEQPQKRARTTENSFTIRNTGSLPWKLLERRDSNYSQRARLVEQKVQEDALKQAGRQEKRNKKQQQEEEKLERKRRQELCREEKKRQKEEAKRKKKEEKERLKREAVLEAEARRENKRDSWLFVPPEVKPSVPSSTSSTEFNEKFAKHFFETDRRMAEERARQEAENAIPGRKARGRGRPTTNGRVPIDFFDSRRGRRPANVVPQPRFPSSVPVGGHRKENESLLDYVSRLEKIVPFSRNLEGSLRLFGASTMEQARLNYKKMLLAVHTDKLKGSDVADDQLIKRMHSLLAAIKQCKKLLDDSRTHQTANICITAPKISWNVDRDKKVSLSWCRVEHASKYEISVFDGLADRFHCVKTREPEFDEARQCYITLEECTNATLARHEFPRLTHLWAVEKLKVQVNAKGVKSKPGTVVVVLK